MKRLKHFDRAAGREEHCFNCSHGAMHRGPDGICGMTGCRIDQTDIAALEVLDALTDLEQDYLKASRYNYAARFILSQPLKIQREVEIAEDAAMEAGANARAYSKTGGYREVGIDDIVETGPWHGFPKRQIPMCEKTMGYYDTKGAQGHVAPGVWDLGQAIERGRAKWPHCLWDVSPTIKAVKAKKGKKRD